VNSDKACAVEEVASMKVFPVTTKLLGVTSNPSP